MRVLLGLIHHFCFGRLVAVVARPTQVADERKRGVPKLIKQARPHRVIGKSMLLLALLGENGVLVGGTSVGAVTRVGLALSVEVPAANVTVLCKLANVAQPLGSKRGAEWHVVRSAGFSLFTLLAAKDDALYASAAESKDAVETQLQEADAAHVRVEAELDDAQRGAAAAASSAEEANAELATARAGTDDDITSLTEALDAAAADKAVLETNLSTASATHARLEAELAEVRKDADDARAAADAALQEIQQKVHAAGDEVAERAAALEQQLLEAQAALEGAHDEARQATEAAAAATARADASEGALAEAQQEKETAEEGIMVMQEEKDAVETKLAEALAAVAADQAAAAGAAAAGDEALAARLAQAEAELADVAAARWSADQELASDMCCFTCLPSGDVGGLATCAATLR